MILINLVIIFNKPTRTSNYTLNIARHLPDIDPTLLTGSSKN